MNSKTENNLLTNMHIKPAFLWLMLFPFLLFNSLSYAASLVITQAEYKEGELIVVAELVDVTRPHIFSLYEADNLSTPLHTSTKTRNAGYEVTLAIAADAAPCDIVVKVNRPRLQASSAVENCEDDVIPPVTGDYVLLGANDLGMHCADLDYQIFSILPPFNVVHAQVIQKGVRPKIMTEADGIEIDYLATSNPEDPAIYQTVIDRDSADFGKLLLDGNGQPILKEGLNAGTVDSINTTSAGKTNFWEIANGFIDRSYGDLAYEPLYPADLLGPLGFLPFVTDLGIPVPAEAGLIQQAMPGVDNIPQPFEKFDTDVSFFTNFGFGSVLAERNWWSTEGIPILPRDNNLNPNAYPLMELRARSGETVLSSLSVVTPVAAEADCQNCHAVEGDCALTQIDQALCTAAAISDKFDPVIYSIGDDVPGSDDLNGVQNAAKINILRLHDAKHATDIANQTPIQCSQCHYSPALDLLQQGPDDSNGREQTQHISMSSAMHGHHGVLTDSNGEKLFPEMPGPIGRDFAASDQILNQTCYQCHPGKKTQCLRGAMFSGGVVCQDCHGDMEQVGNDFSIKVNSNNPGDFVLDGSLRVPWASEPACQSCHTGDALDKNHPADAIIADDGIRLLQAYKTENITVDNALVKVANIIKAPDSRFAENQAVNSDGGTVDVLYRLSVGHGGVMCEGCHNSTHAIWPNAMVSANDNVTSEQLQQHHGTLIECTTCHGENSFDIDDFKDNLDSNGQMKGPHGMHPVNDEMWNDDHKEVDKDSNRQSCRACHGTDGKGTVLSRAATDRVLECKEKDFGEFCDQDKVLHLPKDTVVGCDLCHENFINKN